MLFVQINDVFDVCDTHIYVFWVIKIADKESPGMGVLVEMWHQGPGLNCSLSVSVICDSKKFQVRNYPFSDYPFLVLLIYDNNSLILVWLFAGT